MKLTLAEKTELYETYLSDRAKTINLQIPKGPKISFLKAWDYRGDLKEIKLKTLYDPSVVSKAVKVEEVDLMPVANFKYYQITITR